LRTVSFSRFTLHPHSASEIIDLLRKIT
jgi:hypothetical protein